MKLELLVQYLEQYLHLATHPDYPDAMNGLQVEGRSEIRHICAAVDASEAAIGEAARRGADLLLVHHGMFWEGLRPVTGRHYRKISRLISAGVGLYSVHLPLDSHPEVGNCALLARRLGIELKGRFGLFQGTEIGWWGVVDTDRETFREVVESAVGGSVRLIPGGNWALRRAGVVTGGGGSLLGQAVAAGLDAYVTGEASHHAFVDATEQGLNVYLAGHYATETIGIKALAEHLAANFGLTCEFIDLPSGL
jgi:dinuclear metal center YbgI/SA1388 family protein